MRSPLPSIAIKPGTVSNEELFWQWRGCILPYFESIPLVDPREPTRQPDVEIYNGGRFLFFDSKFASQRFVRDAAWQRQHDDSEHFAIQYYLRGGNEVENGGQDYSVRAGGVYGVNFGYQVEARALDSEVLTVVVPRNELTLHLPELTAAKGTLFVPGSMGARLFGDYLASMGRNLPMATRGDADLMADSVIGLLSVLRADGDPSSRDARHGAFQAIRRYIDDNIGDLSLGVTRLCNRFRMSRASLYRLFEDHGGVRNYVQRRRLVATFKALTEPTNLGRGVFDIALDYGFTSASHFTSRFRAEFGLTPTQVRDAAQAAGARDRAAGLEGGGNNVAEVARWIRNLGV